MKTIDSRYLLSRVKRTLIHGLMLALRLCPIDRNKVMIVSYYGGGYGDNGKAVAEELHRRMPELELVWAVKPGSDGKLPEYVKPVGFRTLPYYYQMATSAIWVDNSRKDPEIIKRRGQYYIQTWHGMVALKQIERDAAQSLSQGYLDSAIQDSRMADVILSGCGFFTDLCRRAFWYEGEILECGSPRLDVLFDQSPERVGQVKERLGIPANNKVLLYAPTFRADMNTDCYIRDYERILDALEEKTGQKWSFAVRLHPNVSDRADFITYNHRVVNATDYPDLYELIPAADMVITDYSSVMFDSALIGKPVALYAKDLEAYTADRNFYFDLKELPFPLSKTQEALTEDLTGFDLEAYGPALERFNRSLNYFETGAAAEAVADRILKVLKK